MTKSLSVLVISLFLTGCSCSPEPSKPANTFQGLTETVKKAIGTDPTVAEEIVGKKKELRIGITPYASNGVEDYFRTESRQAAIVAEAIMKNHRDYPVDRVAFTLIGSLVDKYGNKSKVPLIVLSFDVAELRKINFVDSNFPTSALLELAEPIKYLHSMGKRAVIEYCKDDKHFNDSKKFCLLSAGTSVDAG